MKTVTFLHLRAGFVLTCAMLATACVGNVSGQMTLPADVAARGSYCVERHAEDTRDLASIIAAKLRERGLQAKSGAAGEALTGCDYVVSYTDRWFWDMRMYLADLRIELRDARDKTILGYGQSSQSSLKAMGQTQEDVVATALDQLFRAR